MFLLTLKITHLTIFGKQSIINYQNLKKKGGLDIKKGG
jgi:hypothetical protein